MLKLGDGVLRPRQVGRLGNALLSAVERTALPDPDDALRLPPGAIAEGVDDQTARGTKLAAVLETLDTNDGTAAEAVRRWREVAAGSPFPEVRAVFAEPEPPASLEVEGGPGLGDAPDSFRGQSKS